jgi:hypothetical protein
LLFGLDFLPIFVQSHFEDIVVIVADMLSTFVHYVQTKNFEKGRGLGTLGGACILLLLTMTGDVGEGNVKVDGKLLHLASINDYFRLQYGYHVGPKFNHHKEADDDCAD